MKEWAVAELAAALPEGVVLSDPASLDAYRWDRANDPLAVTPLAVVRAESTEHVQTAVRFAATAGLPVVPRGAGSGLSAGASSPEPCLVISLERMTGIGIDPETRTARVQAGALNGEVKRAAAAHGLWYPPDPSSFEISSIGGNIATNAGGLCCVKYGVTSDYVLGLTVVLADGSAVPLGGPRLKDVAGLSLAKLFVGSEGSLGIVTEAVLRLIPVQPASTTTLVALFPDLAEATGAVLNITKALRPSMLEFMDRATINAVEDELRMGLDRSAEAMLVVQLDEGGVEAIARVERICEARSAAECYSTDDPAEGEAFIAARRAVLPAMERLGRPLVEDIGVPVPLLGELALGVQRIAEEHEVQVLLAAHAGDGNTHPAIIIDPSDPEQERRAMLAFEAIMGLATSLGGTITGEHGIGRLKTPWLRENLGEEAYALNLRIKRALDPQGILNRGVKFLASDLDPESGGR